MGRLDDIVERNRNPKRFGERISVGIGLGLFILVIIGLMVFTNLGERPDGTTRVPAAGPRERRVDDVRLYPGRPTPRDRARGGGSGSASGSGSARAAPTP